MLWHKPEIIDDKLPDLNFVIASAVVEKTISANKNNLSKKLET